MRCCARSSSRAARGRARCRDPSDPAIAGHGRVTVTEAGNRWLGSRIDISACTKRIHGDSLRRLEETDRRHRDRWNARLTRSRTRSSSSPRAQALHHARARERAPAGSRVSRSSMPNRPASRIQASAAGARADLPARDGACRGRHPGASAALPASRARARFDRNEDLGVVLADLGRHRRARRALARPPRGVEDGGSALDRPDRPRHPRRRMRPNAP